LKARKGDSKSTVEGKQEIVTLSTEKESLSKRDGANEQNNNEIPIEAGET